MGEDPLFDSEPTSNGTDPATEDTETSGGPAETPVRSGDTGGNLENTTVYVEGEPLTIDTETTAGELKDMAGAEDEEVLTFRDGDQLLHVNDDKRVLDYAEAGTKFEFQPVTGEEGGVFG